MYYLTKPKGSLMNIDPINTHFPDVNTSLSDMNPLSDKEYSQHPLKVSDCKIQNVKCRFYFAVYQVG